MKKLLTLVAVSALSCVAVASQLPMNDSRLNVGGLKPRLEPPMIDQRGGIISREKQQQIALAKLEAQLANAKTDADIKAIQAKIDVLKKEMGKRPYIRIPRS